MQHAELMRSVAKMCAFLALTSALARAEVVAPTPPETPAAASPADCGTIRLAGVGDVMVHQSVKHTAKVNDDRGPDGGNNKGWNNLFEDVADVMHVADVSFANLETPIIEPTVQDPWFLESGKFPLFKGPPELAAALKWSNFHVVSVANNHSFDQGEKGIASTLDAVRRAGLVPIGAGHTRELAEGPEIMKVRGVNIGFLGATGFLNIPTTFDTDEPQVAVLNDASLPAFCERVRELKARVDLVVMSIHWGEEDSEKPREREVAFAKALCEAGVDVVLGHHPHVLQPIEVFDAKDGRRCVIAYSLGNFVTGNPKVTWRNGAIVIVEAARDPAGKVQLTTYGYVPTWCTNDFSTKRVMNTERMIRNATVALADPTLTASQRATAQGNLAHYEKQLAAVRKVLGPSWVDLTAPGHDKKARVAETPAAPRP